MTPCWPCQRAGHQRGTALPVGLPGGTLEVRLTVTAASVLAEVVDDGPLGVPAAASRDTFAERGRGLVLVEALTRAWGSSGNGLWWFWLPAGG